MRKPTSVAAAVAAGATFVAFGTAALAGGPSPTNLPPNRHVHDGLTALGSQHKPIGFFAIILGATAASEPQAASRASIKVAQSKQHGRFLVDARGHSLYLFVREKGGRIVCKEDLLCTKDFPPFLTNGKPRAGRGANPRLVGTVRRIKPAGLQVTYNRRPLYFYRRDVKPGWTKGHSLDSEWFLISPTGREVN